MNRKKQKYQSLTVRLSEEERYMANELRDKYYIRISRIVGDAIRDCHYKISNNYEQTDRQQ